MARNTEADVLEITQIRSDIGAQQAQRRTLRALGLRRIRHTVSHPDRPEIRGMLAKVAHLVEVRPAEGEGERQRAGGRGSEKQDTQAAKPAKASTKKSSQRPKKKNDEEET
jgi:large subunit ribosomal protein L30